MPGTLNCVSLNLNLDQFSRELCETVYIGYDRFRHFGIHFAQGFAIFSTLSGNKHTVLRPANHHCHNCYKKLQGAACGA